jgi:hypothetical protein
MVTKLRPWTATEIHRLRGLAKKTLEVTKIARSLKRTTAATAVKARALGIPLDARGKRRQCLQGPVDIEDNREKLTNTVMLCYNFN